MSVIRTEIAQYEEALRLATREQEELQERKRSLARGLDDRRRSLLEARAIADSHPLLLEKLLTHYANDPEMLELIDEEVRAAAERRAEAAGAAREDVRVEPPPADAGVGAVAPGGSS